MATLKPYKKYNPVAYDYVSQLPHGWQLLPNIAIFQERIDRGHINEELLSVTIGKGVIKQTDVDIKKDSSNEDKSKYKLIKIGDIAYNKMRMWQGALGYSDYQGISSPAYVILKPKMKINPRFFHYMFRTTFYTNYSKRFSYGIVDDQLSLRYTDFKRMYSIVPPFEVQNSIVEYLDKKNEEINRFIKNKERLIELLDEEKKTFISNTVKNDFLRTPSHWKKTKLKYAISRIGDGLHGTPEYVPESDYYFINGNNLINGKIEIGDSAKPISEAEYRKHKKDLGENTVLYSINGTIGNAAFYNGEKVALGKSAAYINCKRQLSKEYLYYLLQSKIVMEFYITEMNGTTIFNLSLHSLRNTPITIPPIDEQKNIVKELEEGIVKINLAISKAKQEIESIKEYREALVTDLVTGKRSVPQLQMS